MSIAVVGLIIAGVLAVIYFTRKDVKGEQGEQVQNKTLYYGEPGYMEAFIERYGENAWIDLVAKKEADALKRAAAIKEMNEFITDVETSGYSIEGGIPEQYFTDKYGPAWAWSSGTPGRVEALREYWVTHYPDQALPPELMPASAPDPDPWLTTNPVSTTFTPTLAEPAPAITDIEKAKAEQLEVIGITELELPSYIQFAEQVNVELGGSYVGGLLTPPAGWTGSVTEWSRHVQAVTQERYQQLLVK